MFKYVLTALILFVSQIASAQTVEMADALRSEGKIYVVVLLILIVLGGLITYLFLLDRRLTRMEKAINAKTQTK